MSAARRLTLVLSALAVAGQTSIAAVQLRESPEDDRKYSVHCRLKVDGRLQTATPDGKAIGLNLGVAATLQYQERRLPSGGQDAESLRSVRHYQVAEASIDIGDRKTKHQLDPKTRLIVAEGQVDGIHTWAINGPMTYDSQELLRTPADSLALLGLLPSEDVDADSSWKPAAWVLPTLTGVEAVSKNSLTCRLQRLDAQFAIFSVDGSIEGAIHGALTKISLNGQVAYDVKAGHIRQAKITQAEERAVGAVSPGMKVTATMYLDRQVSTLAGKLTDQFIDSIPVNPTELQMALRFDSPAGIEFLYDRNWHIFHQTDEVSVLRLVEKGSLIAQCNISKVPAVGAGQHTSERDFQQDIRTALGARLKQIQKAEQVETDDGRWLYRVTAVGQSGNRPMHWFYYLCAAPDGRQSALVFSVESRLVEQMKHRDLFIAQSLQFSAPQTAERESP